jgi:hypothetical protein
MVAGVGGVGGVAGGNRRGRGRILSLEGRATRKRMLAVAVVAAIHCTPVNHSIHYNNKG